MVADYPAQYINRQAMVYVQDSFYVFGGFTEVGSTQNIGKVTALCKFTAGSKIVTLES